MKSDCQQIILRLTSDEQRRLREMLESQQRISQNLLEIKSSCRYCGKDIRNEEARLLMLMTVLSQFPFEQQFLFGESI